VYPAVRLRIVRAKPFVDEHGKPESVGFANCLVESDVLLGAPAHLHPEEDVVGSGARHARAYEDAPLLETWNGFVLCQRAQRS
jgi:hypothetical protein